MSDDAKKQPDHFRTSASPDDSTQTPRIVVVGSINMDLVVRTAVMPSPGQTVMGHSLATIPGGKGANQAIAAVRCGAAVEIISRLGHDDFGQRLLMKLQTVGVNTNGVLVSENVSTGTAMIIVDDNGENTICIAPGANELLTAEDIDHQSELIAQADAVLIQLEIPQDTAAYVMHIAKHHNVPVILNPAPAPEKINPALFGADIIIANQDETARLTGEPANDVHTAKMAGSALLTRGAKMVIVTLGRRGALSLTADEMFHIRPFPAKVVDTTGAGDAFCGAFAAAYARKDSIYDASRFAAAAGALACGKFGAQPSMPRLCDVQKLIQRSC